MKKILILLICLLFAITLNAQYTNKLTYPLYMGKTGTVTGSIYFYGLTSGTVQLKVPDIAGTSTVFQLPSSNGTADYVLKTDGAGVLSWTAPTNWNTAYSDRLKWDGGSTDLVAATGRTSLGGTTVGQAFFTLTNPSAIRVPVIQTDNSVTATETTGTGNIVLSTSPVFTTPNIGTATGSITGNAATVTGFTPASGSLTLSGADAITLTSTATTAITLPISGTLGAVYSDTMSVSAGVLRTKVTTITREPYIIQIFTSADKDITSSVSDSIGLSGGFYNLYVYSVDALTGAKIKIIY